ncbi:MAG: MFS transporter [Proteobacteria bacterium]|nr:MFS transporter [Pseudomonadota bacterium]
METRAHGPGAPLSFREPVNKPTNKFDWWLLGICSSRITTYLVFMTYAAALSVLQKEWKMSAAAAGSISSGFQFGYAFSLVVFSALADRMGAKRVFLMSNLLSAAASLVFAGFARGYYSGLVLYTLIGVSLGGTYPPALIMIADRYPSTSRGKSVGFFIASTSLSYAFSLGMSGLVLSWGGYRGAFLLTCLGPSVGSILAWITLASTPNKVFPRRQEQKFSTEVLRNKKAVLYITGYAFHSWEILGMWAWTPAFLSACLAVSGSEILKAAAIGAYIVSLFHLMGMTASFSMGTLSDRLGRASVILLLCSLSTTCSFVMGWLIGFPIALVVATGMIYAFSALGDSPILSAGLTESVESSYLGAAFALRSFLGFGAGALSALMFGVLLDLVNPTALETGIYGMWGWSYSALGLGGLGVVWAAYVLRRVSSDRFGLKTNSDGSAIHN